MTVETAAKAAVRMDSPPPAEDDRREKENRK